MKGDASFKQLITVCEKAGWDRGLSGLEAMVRKNEVLQADLFAGDYAQQRAAQRLSQTIIRQNITIARLRQYRIDQLADTSEEDSK